MNNESNRALAESYGVWYSPGDTYQAISRRIAYARASDDRHQATRSRSAERTMDARTTGSIYRSDS